MTDKKRIILEDEVEQDKANYPDFWRQLWQYKETEFDRWYTLAHKEESVADFDDFEDYQYRRHPHYENIIAFNKCSEEEKKHWQCKGVNSKYGWVDIGDATTNMTWHEGLEYRLNVAEVQDCIADYDLISKIIEQSIVRYKYELIKEVMTETHGTVSPKVVRKMIDERLTNFKNSEMK